MYMRVYYHQAFYIVILKHHSLPDAMKIAINPKWILKEACLWFPLRCGKRQTCWAGFIIATYEQAKLHVWGQVVTGCSACSNYNLPTHVAFRTNNNLLNNLVARLWLLFSKYLLKVWSSRKLAGVETRNYIHNSFAALAWRIGCWSSTSETTYHFVVCCCWIGPFTIYLLGPKCLTTDM